MQSLKPARRLILSGYWLPLVRWLNCGTSFRMISSRRIIVFYLIKVLHAFLRCCSIVQDSRTSRTSSSISPMITSCGLTLSPSPWSLNWVLTLYRNCTHCMILRRATKIFSGMKKFKVWWATRTLIQLQMPNSP